MQRLQKCFVHQKTLKYNSKYDLKPSKLFSSIRKRLKSKANRMRRLQKCFRSSENAQNAQQIRSKVFKIVFVHPKTLKIDINQYANALKMFFFHLKTLKMNSKYDLKPSNVFSSIRKRLRSIANSMRMIQKGFSSSENAQNEQQIQSEA